MTSRPTSCRSSGSTASRSAAPTTAPTTRTSGTAGGRGWGSPTRCSWASLLTAAFWLWKRNRAFSRRVPARLRRPRAHRRQRLGGHDAAVPVHRRSTGRCRRGRTRRPIEGGKYLDAAAYYSSLGLVMDLFWLVVVLLSWRVLTREYWRTQIVPADPRVWAWFGRWLPERGLLALYRRLLLRRVPADRLGHLGARRRPARDRRRAARRVTRSTCPGPGRGGSTARTLPHVNPWIVAPVTLALLGVVYWAVSKLWEPMGRAEAARRERQTAADGARPQAPRLRPRRRRRHRGSRPDRGRGCAGTPPCVRRGPPGQAP